MLFGDIQQPVDHETGGEVVGDVRSRVARLEARAMQLLRNTDRRVIRNGRSVVEVAKATTAELARQAANAGPQPPVELFMANLGFNIHEQQRLLHQLHVNHRPSSHLQQVPFAAQAEQMSGGGPADASDVDIPTDFEAFLTLRRAEALQKCFDDVHRQVAQYTRDLSEMHIRSFWERRGEVIAESLEAQALHKRRADPSSKDVELSQLRARPPTAGVATATLNAFAHIVENSPLQEWMSHFNETVQNTSNSSTDEVAALWSSVDLMLTPVIRISSTTGGGSSSTSGTVQRAVSTSRFVMERKYLNALLCDVLKTPPQRLEDMELVNPAKLQEMIQQYLGRGSSTNYWAEIFTAMRCGRYDAAQKFAADVGNRSLEAALSALASVPFYQRNECKSFVELRSQFADDASRSDPYRFMVLFILLVGTTGQDSDAAFYSVIESVCSSVEDMIWVRLTLIRTVENATPALQSLSELQRNIIHDLPQLLALRGAAVIKVAMLLFHVLLPSTALKLLLDADGLFVTGVHIALSYFAAGLLHCTGAETPLNLSSMLQRFAYVLLDSDAKSARRPATAVFAYFSKTSQVEAFTQLCHNEVVCAKLFGQVGDLASNEGALLHGVPTAELLDAMERIADSNAACGAVELAVHILIVLENAACFIRNSYRATNALRRAVQILCPALSHATHSASQNLSLSNLLTLARRLKDRLNVSQHDLFAELGSFQLLCLIVEFHAQAKSQSLESASRSFFSLPFVPSQASEVDSCADLFNNGNIADEVATAMPPTVVAFVRNELVRMNRLPDSARHDKAAIAATTRAVLRWVAKWRIPMSREYSREISAVEEQFNRAV